MNKRHSLKRGEGYVDVCVGIVVFVMVLAISLNIFKFIALKIEMDRIGDELIEAATFSGAFGEDFNKMNSILQKEYFPYEVTVGADEYFNKTYKRVQLGGRMWITVKPKTYVNGIGAFRIPVQLSVKKTGLSERYWK